MGNKLARGEGGFGIPEVVDVTETDIEEKVVI